MKRLDIFPAINATQTAPLFDRYILVVESRGIGDRVGYALHRTFKQAFDAAYQWHKDTGGEVRVHVAGDCQRPLQEYLSAAIDATHKGA